MRLQLGRHLYTWEPWPWLHNWASRNYSNLQTKTLDRTMHWHDMLSDWINNLPDNIPARHFDQIQELRRDIGHFRIDLMSNKLDKLGYDLEKQRKSDEPPE